MGAPSRLFTLVWRRRSGCRRRPPCSKRFEPNSCTPASPLSSCAAGSRHTGYLYGAGLAAILESCEGSAEQARRLLAVESESLEVEVFRDRYHLRPTENSHQARIAVDPDAILEATEVLCLVEAKRIRRRASFQFEQLAREPFVVTREANQRSACLLLILGSPPPVKVKGIAGRPSPADTIRRTLPAVYERAETHPWSLFQLLERVEDHLLWTTWDNIAEVVSRAGKQISTGDRSADASVQRMCRSLVTSVERHS